ncbi:MAG: hypothetical protein KDA28_05055, partial [Phycisphaerales bacterium]|nr:hypothetical protein [Phycisphaerales bacterium]
AAPMIVNSVKPDATRRRAEVADVANAVSWADYDISSDVAHRGEQAALLRLDTRESDNGARIYGVIQEFDEQAFPRYLSGWYRVEDWARGTEKQYIQVVVIAWRPSPMPVGMRSGSYQIAYTLAGVAQPPLRIANRKFILSGVVEPVEDEWIFFEFDLHDDFRKQWRLIPSNYEFVRVLFEVRYDDKDEAEPVGAARVYYDDLYIGPESRAPSGTDVTLPTEPSGGG